MGRRPGSRNKPKTPAAEPAIGHNSGMTEGQRQQLLGYVDRIEKFEAEKVEIAQCVKEVYDAAKDAGFDVSAMRAVVRRRREDNDKARAREVLIDTYMHALGMLADTPLGQAALQRDIPSLLPQADASAQPAA